MKITIEETPESDAILEGIEAFAFVEFTRDGNDVTVHLQSEHPYNIAIVFIELAKKFPDLILE